MLPSLPSRATSGLVLSSDPPQPNGIATPGTTGQASDAGHVHTGGGGDLFADGSVAMTGPLNFAGKSAFNLANVTFETGGIHSISSDAELDVNSDTLYLTGTTGIIFAGGSLLEFDVGGSASLSLGVADIKIQPGRTLKTQGSGMIDLPALFNIATVAVSANVTAANLNTLTGGGATSLHSHAPAAGVVLANGTIPLSANWDVGNHSITGLAGLTFQGAGSSYVITAAGSAAGVTGSGISVVGTAGTVTVGGGVAGTVGGPILISAGAGGAGDVVAAAGIGGAINMTSGAAGAATGGPGAGSGAISIKTGAATGVGNSGDLALDVGAVSAGVRGTVYLGQSASSVQLGDTAVSTSIVLNAAIHNFNTSAGTIFQISGANITLGIATSTTTFRGGTVAVAAQKAANFTATSAETTAYELTATGITVTLSSTDTVGQRYEFFGLASVTPMTFTLTPNGGKTISSSLGYAAASAVYTTRGKSVSIIKTSDGNWLVTDI